MLLRDQITWIRIFAFASMEWTIVVFVCLMIFAIIAMKHREHAIGIALIAMGIFCCPGFPFGLVLGLGYGWAKVRSWQIQTFMTFWTGLTIVAVLNWSIYLFVRFFTEDALLNF